MLIPTLDMVIVVTSIVPFDSQTADEQERQVLELIDDHILTAVVE
jgi:hypothetical protein